MVSGPVTPGQVCGDSIPVSVNTNLCQLFKDLMFDCFGFVSCERVVRAGFLANLDCS